MRNGCLGDIFWESFSQRTKKKAISFFRQGMMETELSYEELHRDTNRMANFFLDLGVKKGDRIILYLPKSLGFIVAYLAILKIGAVAVPLNPGFKHSEMSYLLGDAEATLIISGSDQEAIVREINPGVRTVELDTEKPYQNLDFFLSSPDSFPHREVKPDDIGLIVYTSGTTGRPKGAMLSHKNMLHDAQNIINIWEITESDVLCHALPLFHVHGLCFALHTALMAGSHILMHNKFSPGQVMETLAKKEGEYICTLFMAVPAMYRKMMDYVGDAVQDFGHIRLWTSGSAPLLPKDFEEIKRVFGKKPVEREAMSETGMNFSNPLRGVKKPGSIGLPLPGLEVRIVDPGTLRDVVPGYTGEFWLKSPAITPGYWRKPEETAKAFEGGWFRTGDLGRVDEEGYYYLTDRLKDIIISGGENISPKEVESVINQVEGVIESSVIGISDEEWGEKVVAAAVTRPESGVDPREIQRVCKERLHNWKCPKEIVLLKELPKNRMGKVLKEEVRKLFTH